MNQPEVKSVDSIRDTLGFNLAETYHSHVGGVFLAGDGNGEDIGLVYPATGEQWAAMDVATGADIDHAVNEAATAFRTGPWPGLPVAERQFILNNAGKMIQQHAEELALLECLCTGLPVQHLLGRQIPRAAENFFFFADLIGTLADAPLSEKAGYSTSISRHPVGVTVSLSPWNASLAMASMHIAASIAFGNTCVSKPSEHSPLAVLKLSEMLLEAGLPKGVVNVLCGGPATGMELVQHPRVQRIAFIGKTENGQHVQAAAAPSLTPVQMGLSAKSANIVFADCDIDRAIDGSLVNAFSNAGQICVAGSRILVQRPIADLFIKEFTARAARLRVGDPMDPDTEIGPLGFAEHARRFGLYMKLARSEAEILVGGENEDTANPGCFVKPTVALVKNNNLQVCQEEVFGPFVTIQVFDTAAEAIQICNDSRFGLLAYVWTNDRKLVAELQNSLEVGSLWINTPLMRDLRAPFGGLKDSGIGRDGPQDCTDFYTYTKTVINQVNPTAIRRLGNGSQPA